MQYLITFLEGIVTFISPCVLPMLPVYIAYFAGDEPENKRKRALINALGFVAGFTVFFTFLGIFAGSLGSFLARRQTIVNIVLGAVVIIFGIHYTGILKINFLNRTVKAGASAKPKTFLSSAVFGIVFAVGWSPCTGVFLGSAVMLAASQTGWFSGLILLLMYSLGLGVPFVLCALLIDQLKGLFASIKKRYHIINMICGIFLILVGILMMAGVFSKMTASFL